MTSMLDEIAARHDLLDASYKGACSCCNPPKSHVDRGKLVDALRAVEAVHVWEMSGDAVPVPMCRECQSNQMNGTYPCPTITAIREALA